MQELDEKEFISLRLIVHELRNNYVRIVQLRSLHIIRVPTENLCFGSHLMKKCEIFFGCKKYGKMHLSEFIQFFVFFWAGVNEQKHRFLCYTG